MEQFEKSLTDIFFLVFCLFGWVFLLVGKQAAERTQNQISSVWTMHSEISAARELNTTTYFMDFIANEVHYQGTEKFH